MGGDKPLPYNGIRRGGVYPRPVSSNYASGSRGTFHQLYDFIHDVWTFSHGEKEFKIKVSGNRASNDGDVVRRWCVSGKGLAVKSCLDMSTD